MPLVPLSILPLDETFCDAVAGASGWRELLRWPSSKNVEGAAQLAQGYYFARPLPHDEAESLLGRGPHVLGEVGGR